MAGEHESEGPRVDPFDPSGAVGEPIHRGNIVVAGQSFEYYTLQPAPMQWVAVGVMPLDDQTAQMDTTHRMLVGNGTTEDEAVAALRERLAELLGHAETRQEPRNKSEPSHWFGMGG